MTAGKRLPLNFAIFIRKNGIIGFISPVHSSADTKPFFTAAPYKAAVFYCPITVVNDYSLPIH
jgi:hypothetical protein